MHQKCYSCYDYRVLPHSRCAESDGGLWSASFANRKLVCWVCWVWLVLVLVSSLVLTINSIARHGIKAKAHGGDLRPHVRMMRARGRAYCRRSEADR